MLISTKRLICTGALLAATLPLTLGSAQAQLITTPIAYNGGNADLVYDSSTTNGTTGPTVVGLGDYAFTANYSGAGSIASNLAVVTADGNSYQVGPLSADSGSRTDLGAVELTLNTAAEYSKIGFLAAGADGGGTVDYTLNYADGSSVMGSFSVPDWYSASTPGSGNNSPGFTVVGTGTGSTIGSPLTGQSTSSLYMYDFTTGTLPTTSALESIDLTQVSGKEVGIFAVSGEALETPEPSTSALLLAGLSLMVGAIHYRRRLS